MNANYIYDIFETCEEKDLPDLTLALAHLKATQPIPDGLTEKQVNTFVGDHYEDLVKAYKAHDRTVFAAAVAAAVLEDEEEEKEKEEEAQEDGEEA